MSSADRSGLADQVGEQVHSERQLRFWIQVSLAPLLLALALLLLPLDVPTPRRLAGVAVTLLTIPLAILVLRRRSRWVRGTSFPVGDLVAICIVTIIVPEVWVAGAVVIAMLICHRLGIDRTHRVVAEMTVAVLVLGAIGWSLDIHRWWLVVATIAITGAASTLFYLEWDRQSSEIDKRLVELIENAELFLWRVDPVSGRFLSVTGDPEPIIGRTVDDLTRLRWQDLTPDGLDPFADLDLDLDGEQQIEHRIRFGSSEGEGEAVLLSVLQQTATGLAGRTQDITAQSMLTAALTRQARHDALTGLVNRSHFSEVLEDLLHNRLAPQRVGLLHVDLNRFKAVNDALGHYAGDALLRAIGERLRDAAPADATVARIGGDEFAVVIPDTTASNVEVVAQRLHDKTRGPVQVGSLSVNAELSIGAAVAPDQAATADELMQCADAATYAAKRSAAGVCVYSPQLAGEDDSARFTAELPRALEGGEFELWFEPIVSLSDLTIIGVEGLARWRHPRHGVLLPGEFLDLLEIGSDEQRFADQMAEQAIVFAARALERGHDLRVSVNLGLRSFADASLPTRIASLLDTYRVPPGQLVLELTEVDVLDDTASAMVTFDALAELGVSLSIDDFGMGYSSFDRLRNMPVRELKIDRSFVQRSGTHPEDLIIVKTVTELARLLHLVVVGEGIETIEHLTCLRDIGCDLGQGWLFSRTLQGDDMLDLLARGLRIDADLILDLDPPKASVADISLSAASPSRPFVVDCPTGMLIDSLADPNIAAQLGLELFEDLPVGAFIKAPDGRFLWSNRFHTNLVAVDGALVDLTDAQVHEPAEARRYRSDDLQVIATGEAVLNRAEPQTRPDGTVVELRTTKLPIRSTQGDIIGLFGYFVEIGPLTDLTTATVPAEL